jgi:hypothetical protein
MKKGDELFGKFFEKLPRVSFLVHGKGDGLVGKFFEKLPGHQIP